MVIIIVEDAVVAERPPNMRKRSSTFRHRGFAYLVDRSLTVRYVSSGGNIARYAGGGDGDGDRGSDALFSSGGGNGEDAGDGDSNGEDAGDGDGDGEHAGEHIGEDADGHTNVDEDGHIKDRFCLCF